jgi:hypothetical protein
MTRKQQIPLTDEEILAAKQLETYAIDVNYALSWVTTMQQLVDEGLDDVDFTAKRMDKLRVWTKGRKLAQSRLRHRYDLTGRRKRHLVDRDARAIRETAHAQIDAYKAKLAAQRQALEERSARPLG